MEERYQSKDEYVHMVDDAARALVDEGYMLEEDIERVKEQAAVRYGYWSDDTES